MEGREDEMPDQARAARTIFSSLRLRCARLWPCFVMEIKCSEVRGRGSVSEAALRFCTDLRPLTSDLFLLTTGHSPPVSCPLTPVSSPADLRPLLCISKVNSEFRSEKPLKSS